MKLLILQEILFIVHRDLKFANIMFDSDSNLENIVLVLVDFSEARGIETNVWQIQNRMLLSFTGAVVGNYAHLCPEEYHIIQNPNQGKNYNAFQKDTYGVGVTSVEICSMKQITCLLF